MEKAIIYTRSVSGSQLAEQMAVCEKYASENGYKIVGVYSAIGIADINSLLRKIQYGDFGYIITARTDRIARNMQEYRIVKRNLLFMGVQLIEINKGAE